MKEIKAIGLTWGEAVMAALDRIGWIQRVEASCSVRGQEQEEEEETIKSTVKVSLKTFFLKTSLRLAFILYSS